MDRDGELRTVVMTDNDIIALFWRRDETAIHETDAKYGKLLFRIAYQILKDKTECEECQNDTYLAAWMRIPPTRPVVLSAFLSKIMRNTAVDKYKARRRQKHVPSELTVSLDDLASILSGDASPEAELAAKELGGIISAYIRCLSEKQRYIFIERFYLAETLEHIAEELDISISSVHRETERIKRGLKTHLEKKGVIV